MGWAIVLVIYAVLVSAALVFFEYRRRGAPDYLSTLRGLVLSNLPLKEEVSARIDIAKLEQQETPWYERAVSKVGVVAFITSAIGVALQSITASIETRKVEALRQEIKIQSEAVARAQRLFKDVAATMIATATQEGRALTEDEQEILVERRKQLRAVEKPSEEQCREQLRIGLALRDPCTVVRAKRQCPSIDEGADDADKVTLAVFLYLEGSDAGALEQLAPLRSLPKSVPIIYRSTVVVLSAVLEPSKMDDWARAYAGLIKADDAHARPRLESEVEKMKRSKAVYDQCDATAP